MFLQDALEQQRASQHSLAYRMLDIDEVQTNRMRRFEVILMFYVFALRYTVNNKSPTKCSYLIVFPLQSCKYELVLPGGHFRRVPKIFKIDC